MIKSNFNKKIFVPRIDSEGMLETDFLLITKMRNFMSPNSINTGKHIISIGGTHGTATKAIHLLLKDKQLLSELHPFLSKNPYCYQILPEVGKMDHNSSSGTRATKIRLADEPKMLEDSVERWKAATEIGSKNRDRQWNRKSM